MAKRRLSRKLWLAVALLMAISLLSVVAFAAETEGTEVRSAAYQYIEAEFSKILDKYKINPSMTREEIDAEVAEMDWETYITALSELVALEESYESAMLTEEEAEILVTENQTAIDFYDSLYTRYANDDTVSTFVGESATLDVGLTVGCDDNGTLSQSGDVLTVTATSTSRWTRKTTEITVSNTTGKKVKVSFNYTVSNQYNLTIDSSTNISSPYTITVAKGGSFKIKLQSKTNSTATLTLSGFAIEDVPPTTSQIAIEGSGSVSVDGVDKDNGSSASVSADGSAFVATPASGYTFLCWANSTTNQILSFNASETFSFDVNTPVKAIFVNNTVPYFRVGTEAIFDDLQKAINYVGTAQKTIILACDGTISGSYTIPTNATLLIPFDAADTTYTTTPTPVENWTKPTYYRTLTMAEGATLTVKGAISVSAKQSSRMGYNGSPTGPVGLIRMSKNSKITVENGGKLYAWGFITGSSEASVEIQSGGKVYENFQIADWRGGSAGSSMVVDEGMLELLKSFTDSVPDTAVVNPGTFPISQYYVQNIEVPMTLAYGAVEGGSTAIDAPIVGVQSPSVDFIGKADDSNFEGMFRLESGSSLTKWYDGTKDRLHVTVNGTLNLADMKLNVATIFYVISIEIDSTKYTLPINSNITVHIPSGSKVVVKQDVALLPGVEIIIEEGGELEVADDYDMTVYDADEWNAATYAYGGKWVPVRFAPGKTYTRVEADLKDARIEVNGLLDGSLGSVYVTAGGADICSTGKGRADLKVGVTEVIYQATQSGTAITYVEVPIHAARLKHETGEYLTVGATAATTYNYDHHICGHDTDDVTATHGLWISGTHTETTTRVEPDCVNAGSQTVDCRSCGHTHTVTIPALGHNWGETTYAWSEDGKTCSAQRVCTNNAEHIETETVAATSEETALPTCSEKGTTTYTATFTATWAETRTKEKDIEPTGIHTDTDDEGTDGYLVCDTEGCNMKLAKLSMNVNADAETELVLKFLVHDELVGKLNAQITFGGVAHDDTHYEWNGNELTVMQPVASAEMTKLLRVELSSTEGSELVFAIAGTKDLFVERSVVDYARAVLQSNTTSQEAKDLVTAMVTYGGYAQLHFAGQEGYTDITKDVLAYNVLEEVGMQVPDISTVTINDQMKVHEAFSELLQDVSLGSAIKQDVIFVLADGYSFVETEGNVVLTLTYKKSFLGEESTTTLTAKKETTDEGTTRYVVSINNIPAAFLNYNYQITGKVVKDGTEDTFTITPSVTAYLGRILDKYDAKNVPSDVTEDLANLAKAMYLYNQKAYTFFSQVSTTAETEVSE